MYLFKKYVVVTESNNDEYRTTVYPHDTGSVSGEQLYPIVNWTSRHTQWLPGSETEIDEMIKAAGEGFDAKLEVVRKYQDKE